MAVDYAQLQGYVDKRKALRQEKFDASFWESKIRGIMANSGEFNVKDKTLSIPQDTLANPTDMWNQYIKATQSRGLKPNYGQFIEQYNNLSKVKYSNLMNTLSSAEASGMSPKDIRKAIKNNPELTRLVNEAIKLAPNEDKAKLGLYVKPGSKSFLEAPMENLLTLGVGLGGAYAAGKAGPIIAEKWNELRGSESLKSMAEITDKKIDPKTAKAMYKDRTSRAAYKKYVKDFKGKGKRKPLSEKKWAKRFKTPKNWSAGTLAEAEKLLGPDKLKKLNLINPKPSVGKTLLSAAPKVLKGASKRFLPAAAAMALFEYMTKEE